MILAHPLIFTAYGWLLPNDPRGSSSHTIRTDVLRELGEIHHGRKKIQPCSRVTREFSEEARPVLKHDLRTFDQHARRVVACGFAQGILYSLNHGSQ